MAKRPALGDQFIAESGHVPDDVRIGVLINGDRRRGVGNEDRHQPVLPAVAIHHVGNLTRQGDELRAVFRGDAQFIGLHSLLLSPVPPTVRRTERIMMSDFPIQPPR